MKTPKIIIAILVLVFTNASAQESNSNNKFVQSVKIGFQYTGISTIEIGDFLIRNDITENSENRYGATIGWRLQRPLGDKVYSQIGLNINYITHHFEIDGLLFGNDVIPGTGTSGTTSAVINELSVLDLEIPISLGYFITRKFYFNLGASGHVIIANFSNEKTCFGDGTVIESNNNVFKRFGVNYHVGLGYVHTLNEKLSIFIEPRYKARLLPKAFFLSTSDHIPWYGILNVGIMF